MPAHHIISKDTNYSEAETTSRCVSISLSLSLCVCVIHNTGVCRSFIFYHIIAIYIYIYIWTNVLLLSMILFKIALPDQFVECERATWGRLCSFNIGNWTQNIVNHTHTHTYIYIYIYIYLMSRPLSRDFVSTFWPLIWGSA